MLSELFKKRELPTMKQFEELRVNQEMYSIFFDRFVPCVIGKDKYKKHCLVSPPSAYTNEGDEAMTLLILANNYSVWTEITTLDEQDGQHTQKHRVGDLTSKQRFFVNGQGRGRSWSREGRQYYNLMFELIRADRRLRGENFDNCYLRTLQDEDVNSRTVRRDRRRSKARLATERINCHNNYDDDDDVDENNTNSDDLRGHVELGEEEVLQQTPV